MATDANRIVVAGRARLYLAPVGTAAPTDSVAALAAAWREVGYTTEDGTSFSTDPSFESVRAHQTDVDVRRFKTGDSQLVSADLEEWSADNFAAVFGGGTVTVVTAGAEFKYEPPDAGGRRLVAAILEITDGTKRYRFVFPRASQTEGVELGLVKTGAAVLPLRLGVEQASDSVKPWYLLTNDSAFGTLAAA
jgi:hypothetical protein